MTTARHYDYKATGQDQTPAIHGCPLGCLRADGKPWEGPLAWFPHCERCGKHHALVWHHEGQCSHQDPPHGMYCQNPVRMYGRKPGNLCREHAAAFES